jgi:aminoglycoside 2''-phosphotransferase
MQKAATQIGTFLSVLHKVCPSTIEGLGVPQFTPARMLERQQELYAEIRQQAFPVLSAEEQAWIERLFTSFLAGKENWRFETVLTHGDLDGSNILCDPDDGTLLGIIDFEESSLGDPACDFCVLSAEYGPAFLETLLNAYGQPPDANFGARIAFHTQRVLFHEILYGLEEGEARFIEHGLMRLRRAMSGLEPIGGWLVASTAESRSVESYPY